MSRAVPFAFLVTACFAQSNEQMQQLFKDYYEERLRENPEIATARGRIEYNDRWKDWTRAGIERREKKRQEFLDQLRPFLGTKLPEQDSVSARMLRYLLERQGDTEPLDIYLLRVAQMNGAHNNIYRTVDLMPRNTVRDYENIIARLNAVPAYVEQNISLFTEAIDRGLIQPAVVVDRVLTQLRAQTSQDASKTELLAAFRKFPTGISDIDRRRLLAQVTTAYNDAFLPAWRKLTAFVEKTYAPKARTSIALTAVPNGKTFYAAQVRSMTTTSLTPEQIHELGKQEVKRLEAEMLAVVRESGFQGSLTEYEKKLADSPDQHFKSKDDMLAYCRNVAQIVEPELSRLFKRLPRLYYGIRAIPPETEASSASNAQAQTEDGSRPGWFNLNTYQPQKQVKYDKEALVLHEAVPGHLFQLALALEAGDLPAFRKGAVLSAYVEGWALYAESLGSELGVYHEPASRFGRLDSERFRAVRLVVDTGMHAFDWSRAQAIDYFTTHAPTETVAEIDRYISWPGQALSYKMGQLRILDMRRRAEKELGPKFDIREFHDAMLRNGALPMELLEEVANAYIAGQR